MEPDDIGRLAYWRTKQPVVSKHFGLTADDQHTAYLAAARSPNRAAICYEAIANSLRPMRWEKP